MGSSRLPGKILKTFYEDQTLLDTLLNSLHKIKDVKIIVATSEDSNNDSLENYLKNKNELVFRGSETDVLDRFIKAAELYHLDGIIRICSDNPFLDWKGVQRLVEEARKSDADYIGYRINNTPSILTHFGFWAEYVTLKALKQVAKLTEINSPAHEHVTFYVYKHPEIFNCSWIECPVYLQGRSDIRLTIDTAEDLVNAQKVYKDLIDNNENFSLEDVVNYLDNHKDIKESMLQIISTNKK